MTTKADACAFPVPFDTWAEKGLTKREYFAALAMKGLLADSDRAGSYRSYAHDAVDYADALIAALNEEPQP